MTPETAKTISDVSYALLLLDIGFLCGYMTKVFMINYQIIKKKEKETHPTEEPEPSEP